MVYLIWVFLYLFARREICVHQILSLEKKIRVIVASGGEEGWN